MVILVNLSQVYGHFGSFILKILSYHLSVDCVAAVMCVELCGVFYCPCLLCFLLPAALCREECDAWVRALRHVMHHNNFSSHLLSHR